MRSTQEILIDISEHKHKTGYGTNVSKELLQVFRIKNLFLFSLKLLQKYELLTMHACAQLDKHVLTKHLAEQENEIKNLELQLNRAKTSFSSMKKELETLRQQLISMGENHFLPSGHSKAFSICNFGSLVEPGIFVNCDDLFRKQFTESRLSVSENMNFVTQKPPIEFYEELMHLQMHFNVLIVQGCNFALPLLSTRLSFLYRVVYWPTKPLYGLVNKTAKLKDKLGRVKDHITGSLEELIKAIGEMEKWILFYQNSQEVYNTLIKASCVRKKELLFEINNFNLRTDNLQLEHSRLVGAILKINPQFFFENEKSMRLSTSNSSASKESSTALSAFSKHSVKPTEANVNPTQEINDNLENEHLHRKNSVERFNHNALPNLSQTIFNKLTNVANASKPPFYKTDSTSRQIIQKPYESDSVTELKEPRLIFTNFAHRSVVEDDKSIAKSSVTSVKSPEICSVLSDSKKIISKIKSVFNPANISCRKASNVSSQSSLKIPATGASLPRLMNIHSSPDDALHCKCVTQMPPVSEIRKSLLEKRAHSQNQSNLFIYSMFRKYSKEHTKSKKRRAPLNLDALFQHIKEHPKYIKIDTDIKENLFLLNKLSDENNNNEKVKNRSFVENSYVLNAFSKSSYSGAQPELFGINSNINRDYFDILNMFLESCGYKPSCSTTDSGAVNGSANHRFTEDVFDSLNREQDILSKNYTINSLNFDKNLSSIISDGEAQLIQSLKLYSKYLN